MELSTQAIPTIAELHHHQLTNPTYVFRAHTLTKIIKHFNQAIPATLLYAVKTNPSTLILQALHHEGIRHFDVASLNEVETLSRLFDDIALYFMHPVKPRHAIRAAYFHHHVKHYSFDSHTELNKIIEATDYANDLSLHLRLRIDNTYSQIALSDKFGFPLNRAPSLLKLAKQHAHRLGISFHVGSQCMEPLAYYNAILTVAGMLDDLDLPIAYFNIGGGFPSVYTNMQPPPLDEYFQKINAALAKLNNRYDILAEPGRALVAETMSLIVRVDLRKGQTLYINDGTYGGLFDAGTPNFCLPCQMIRPRTDKLSAFQLYGPTCDSLDVMPGPFFLPEDIEEGDYIEIGQMGAYSAALASPFNGFEHNPETISVSDEPILTMYNARELNALTVNPAVAA